jgi:outer membrane lipoprotein-sorting protein
MEDAFGLRTEIRFQKVISNPELDPRLFTFTPPESADVIGEIQR